MGPLSQRSLAGLKAYEYHASGYTWMDDMHQPMWNWIVNRLPLWLAPNLITLAGTLCIVAAYVLNLIYNPSFTEEAPAWVYWITAASVVLYVNLDCMDGKQARRTGSSSPLGQLFDHGCDALALHMMLANISSSLGVGCGWKQSAGCLGIMAPWIFAQWEEYHTGVMMYGNGAYGVLEANYSIVATHILSACFGLKFWRAQIPIPAAVINSLTGAPHLSSPAASLSTLTVTVADAALLVVSLAGVAQAVGNISRVVRAQRKGALPEKKIGNKQVGRLASALHLLGLCATMALGAWSLAVSNSGNSSRTSTDQATATVPGVPVWQAWLGSYNSLPGCGTCQCRVAFSMFGLLYALTATQLILAHMAKEPWLPSLLALACPILHITATHLQWNINPLALLFALHTVASVAYTTYVLGAISQICAFLDIRCLSITPVANRK